MDSIITSLTSEVSGLKDGLKLVVSHIRKIIVDIDAKPAVDILKSFTGLSINLTLIVF